MIQAVCALIEVITLVQITKAARTIFNRVDEFVDFTMRATAEAITGHLNDNAALQAEIERVRRGAA